LLGGRICLLREFRQLVHQADEDVLDVDVHIQIRSGIKKLLQRLKMIFIREGLNHALHEILLGHGVLADDDDIQDSRKNDRPVNVVSDTVQIRESDNVLADGDAELIAFHFAHVVRL